MIRLIQRRLIIPRGDTGFFTIPVLANSQQNSIAVFSIIDPLTQTLVFQKPAELTQDNLLKIVFTYQETVKFPVGRFLWDIKYYINPTTDESGKITNADEVDSYYAGFSLPICEIRQTGDSLPIME